MTHHFDEQAIKKIFSKDRIPEPNRAVLSSILEKIEIPVTKTTTARILNQKGTDEQITFFENLVDHMNKRIKMLVPIATAFAVLVLVVYNKGYRETKLPVVSSERPGQTTQTAAGTKNETRPHELDTELSNLFNELETEFAAEDKTIKDYNTAQIESLNEETNSLINLNQPYETQDF